MGSRREYQAKWQRVWANPATRKIDGRIYKIVGEGLQKSHAITNASMARKGGLLARVVRDNRRGKYCVYIRSR